MEERSPNLTKIVVDLPGHWAGFGGESVWAEHLREDLYRLENLLFYAYGLNFHDVVLAKSPGPDRKPEVISVVEASGHQTLRLLFRGDPSENEQTPYLDELGSFGVDVERASSVHLALDIPPSADLNAVRDRLDEWTERGIVEYETCEVRVAGSFSSAPSEDE